MKKRIRVISSLLVWRVQKNINFRTFVLSLSFVVGILSGLAAVALKEAVHFIGHLLTHGFESHKFNYINVAFPLVGILLTVLFIKYFVKDNIGHGVSKILFAISKKNSMIKSHNNFSSMIASLFTVGFGGSVGLEAPIVLTGSSIGSNLGRFLRCNYKTTTLLIGCGAAGAIAGIFKAPIAALIFALEVLMLDLTMWSIVPLLIASVSGATISMILSGKDFVFEVHSESLNLHSIPFYVLLGVMSGLVSLYFTRGVMKTESIMGKFKSPASKLIIGGFLLGLIIFILPPLYGEGYGSLTSLLNGQALDLANGSIFDSLKDNFIYFSLFLFIILFFKVIATALTTGSGGVGGIFAPTLFMGGVTGALFARLINGSGFFSISEKNFALAGMAGLMAGVMHAPLTAIFLIAEITGGYTLFVPLMITATISFLTINRFERHSIYTHRLAQKGHLITHDKDRAVLTRLDIDRVIEKDLKTVHPEDTLRQLIKVIAQSKRNIFPVIDDKDHLIGVILLDNIRDIIFNTEMYDTAKVENLMVTPPSLIFYGEEMEIVINKFENTGSWNLPVIKDGSYYGFVSKSKLFSVYRKRLKDITDD